jgi:hypothetical protein
MRFGTERVAVTLEELAQEVRGGEHGSYEGPTSDPNSAGS